MATKESELREIQLKTGASMQEIVDVIREVCPKFDKPTLSKCKNSEYGVNITPEAMAAVRKHFGVKPRDKHRISKQIRCRLPAQEYDAFKAKLAEAGLTAQQFIEEEVRKYVETHDGTL